jgi:hypothetical protein
MLRSVPWGAQNHQGHAASVPGRLHPLQTSPHVVTTVVVYQFAPSRVLHRFQHKREGASVGDGTVTVNPVSRTPLPLLIQAPAFCAPNQRDRIDLEREQTNNKQ